MDEEYGTEDEADEGTTELDDMSDYIANLYEASVLVMDDDFPSEGFLEMLETMDPKGTTVPKLDREMILSAGPKDRVFILFYVATWLQIEDYRMTGELGTLQRTGLITITEDGHGFTFAPRLIGILQDCIIHELRGKDVMQGMEGMGTDINDELEEAVENWLRIQRFDPPKYPERVRGLEGLKGAMWRYVSLERTIIYISLAVTYYLMDRFEELDMDGALNVMVDAAPCIQFLMITSAMLDRLVLGLRRGKPVIIRKRKEGTGGEWPVGICHIDYDLNPVNEPPGLFFDDIWLKKDDRGS